MFEIAAAQGDIDIVKWLYERGADWHTLWEISESDGYIEKNMLGGAVILQLKEGTAMR
ncbi:hypothetical protein PC114_g27050 [Phytophthora cactorum]|nr:hypothetical protein PC114_g27050 [Phytophthora cactorum]